MYSKKIFKEFKHPANVGEIKAPDGVGKMENITCGDIMHIYIKVGKNRKGKEIIKDIKFKTLGCVVAIANSSLLTKTAKGKTLEEAMKLTKQDLIKKLGEMPPIKYHCSILALDALHKAIEDYWNKKAMAGK